MGMSGTVAARRAVGRRVAALAGVAVAVAAAGCSGTSSASPSTSISTTATIGGSSPSPSATPSASPSGQQAQALAGAVKAYNEYWSRLENVLATHGDATRLGRIARANAYSYAATVAQYASSRGYTLRGHFKNVYVKPNSFV